MRTAPTPEEFFSDDGGRFLRIGDLQVIKEHVRKLRRAGGESELVLLVEEIIPRVENSFALLLRLLDEWTSRV